MDAMGVYITLLALLVFFTGGITAVDRELESLKKELSRVKHKITSLEGKVEIRDLEFEILKLHSEGYTPRRIAEELNVPLKVVVEKLSKSSSHNSVYSVEGEACRLEA